MITLRAYQQPHAAQLVDILRARLSAHDGSDMGTGKTYVAASVIADMKTRTLVICPLSVMPTWEKILGDAGANLATVTTWERVWRKFGRKIPCGNGSYFEFSEQWPLFVFDEVHRAGGLSTMQSKVLIAATRQALLHCGKILTLSATAADSPLKMRALGFALGLHRLDNFYSWLDANGCPELTMGPKNDPKRQWKQRLFLQSRQAEVLSRLNAEVYASRGARLRIADIPDFPSTQIGVRLLDGHDREVQRLDTELRKFYDNRRALLALADDDLTKLTYARQAMEVAKVPALLDMIEDALETSKVAVFANYSATLDALAEACEKRRWSHGFIRGDTTPSARKHTIDSFQADHLDVCLANIQAGGVGVSLHSLAKVPRTALLCPTFSAIDLRQCLGRCRRDGGGSSVQHLVYFRGTVEERVADAVQRKLANIDALNDGDLDESVAQAVMAL